MKVKVLLAILTAAASCLAVTQTETVNDLAPRASTEATDFWAVTNRPLTVLSVGSSAAGGLNALPAVAVASVAGPVDARAFTMDVSAAGPLPTGGGAGLMLIFR